MSDKNMKTTVTKTSTPAAGAPFQGTDRLTPKGPGGHETDEMAKINGRTAGGAVIETAEKVK